MSAVRARRRWRFWRGLALVIALAVLGAVSATVAPIALLRWVDPPTSAFMLRSHVVDPATGQACDRVEFEWADFEEIAPDLAYAIVLAEDQRFFQHRGFDVDAIDRAVRERAGGGRLRGASTLTQQVAKNLFLSPEKSFARKGLEAWLATWIELLWSKRRILEIYLNVAQFGPCCFGAGAASERYFERGPAALELEQVALLATVLPNPLKLRAHNPGPYARERRDAIVSLMETHRNGPVAWHVRRLARP